jgi:glycosyltransferase involved in cell wall biosynthesis
MCSVMVSVIIPVYNGSENLEVLLADYEVLPRVELVVVDGAAGDHIEPLLQKYSSKISRYLSEKDLGIYDAMNKGVGISLGKYVFFMGADDRVSPNGMKELMDFLQIDMRSDLVAFPVLLRGSKIVKPDLNRETPILHHQGFLMSRKLIQVMGGFTLDYKVHSDYDLMLRAYSMSSCDYFHEPICIFESGGVSTSGKNCLTSIKELLTIYFRRGGSVFDFQWCFFILRPLYYFLRAK